MRQFLKYFFQIFGLSDIIVFGGLVSLAYGTYQVHQPTAFIVVGLILMGFGLWGYLRS